MQKPPAFPQFWDDRTTARVNGVDVCYGADFGVFIPDSDPQGEKRPFVIVPENCPTEDIQALTRKARERCDFLRELDGYAPVRWEMGP